MTIISKACAKLASFPNVRVDTTPTSVTVHPIGEHGFRVALESDGDEHRVMFEGWHERFASEDDALACFAFGLSDCCRLAITYRGETPVKWTVESLENGVWAPDSTTGLLFVPFWRRSRVEYRSNALLGGKPLSSGVCPE